MLILLTKSFMGSVLKKVCLQNRVSLSLGKKAEGYLTLFNIYGNAHDEELFIKRAIDADLLGSGVSNVLHHLCYSIRIRH